MAYLNAAIVMILDVYTSRSFAVFFKWDDS